MDTEKNGEEIIDIDDEAHREPVKVKRRRWSRSYAAEAMNGAAEYAGDSMPDFDPGDHL